MTLDALANGRVQFPFLGRSMLAAELLGQLLAPGPLLVRFQFALLSHEVSRVKA